MLHPKLKTRIQNSDFLNQIACKQNGYEQKLDKENIKAELIDSGYYKAEEFTGLE